MRHHPHMDWTRVDAVADELSATRAEVLGLVLLVLGGVVVAWLVVQRPLDMAAFRGTAEVTSPAVGSSDLVGDAGGTTGIVGGSAADGAGVAAGAGGAGGTGDAAGPPSAVPTGRQEIVVHVTGAVAAPGVVELDAGDRVVDAVTAAGAATTEAALDALNMARLVVDGERIHVPTQQEVEDGLVPAPSVVDGSGDGVGGPDTAEGAVGAGAAGAAVRDAAGRLDLNRATQTDFEELPGIGPVIAGRIIAWREANGGFKAVGQLREITGIGERTFQSLTDVVVVP